MIFLSIEIDFELVIGMESKSNKDIGVVRLVFCDFD